jgi:Tfp pilus assembly protein PilF
MTPNSSYSSVFRNVFNSLSDDARKVASTLASVSGSQTVASLAFFAELDSIGIQSSLSILITSNLVTTERGRSSEDEDRYSLSPLARLYIQQFIRPRAEEQKRLIAKQNELRSAQEEFSAKAGADVFDMRNIFVRERDDYIVAKILTKAIEHIFRKDLVAAASEIDKAADLSPNYFEVHRVRAMMHEKTEDVFAAEASYETAISLASERAALRLWFAQFLSRQLGHQDRALEQLLKAEELAPQSAYVKLECARVLQYHRQFDDAGQRLNEVQDVDKLPARTRRVHLDLSMQNYLRRAEFYSSKEQYVAALECFEEAKRILSSAVPALVDQVTLRHVSRSRRHLVTLKRVFAGTPEESRVALIENGSSRPLDRRSPKAIPNWRDRAIPGLKRS